MQRLRFIDALRSLAITGVLIVHTTVFSHLPANSYFTSLANTGTRGVQLFFIVSAFTLFYSLDHRKDESHPHLSFLIRRFFRIAPLFYVSSIFYAITLGLGHNIWRLNPNTITWQQIVMTTLFLNGWKAEWINSGLTPGQWSVVIEMQFYLLVPFLFLRIKSISTAIFVFIAVYLLSIMANQVALSHPASSPALWLTFVFSWLPNQLPVFLIGIILYFIYRDHKDALSQEKTWLAKRLLIVFICASLAIPGIKTTLFWPGHLLASFAFLALAISLLLQENKWIVNRFTVFVGKISYSIYLVHFAIINLAEKIIIKTEILSGTKINGIPLFLLTFSIVFVLVIPVAHICYKLIEQNGIKLGKKIVRKINSTNTVCKATQSGIVIKDNVGTI